MMASRFASTLRRLSRLFRGASAASSVEIRFALIGGLAVSVWGRVRATQDLDVLADSAPSPLQDRGLRDRLETFWGKQKCGVEWRIGASDDPIPLLLHLALPEPANVAVDVLWAWKAWQREALTRACTVRTARTSIAVLHPEDLILMKLDAGGPQDLLDVESILAAKPPELELPRLMRAAAKLRFKSSLDRCLRRTNGK